MQAAYLVCALFLCTVPANFFIRWFIGVFKISKDWNSNNDDLLRAGRIIGALERILSIILIVAGHIEAVGFIFAAKSILRFKEADTAKTEYLLVGSLLSFFIAVVFGIGFKFIH